MSNWVAGRAKAQVSPKDVAETFDEPDVTVSGGLHTTGGNLSLDRAASDSVDISITSGGSTGGGGHGIKINPKVRVEEITVDLDSSATAVGDTVVETVESGEQARTSSLSAGGSHTFSGLSIPESEEIWVYTYCDYRPEEGTNNFPVVADTFEITSNLFDAGSGSYNGDGVYSYSRVAVNGEAVSASPIVSWPEPDVFAWTAVVFDSTTPADSTCQVFIEDSSGSEVAGPVSRGDSIPLSDTENPRFRVELTEGSGGEVPSLEYLARGWLL
ncbi:hypothetical protein [Haloferax sp. Q22]|uniref:hypothetical protein n=1 Tax=Haloferax sp. (strain Q22) TaxID=1526048 RepID=UPI000737BAC5|nr:hypothetical protein [Haloferax sp. Q22]